MWTYLIGWWVLIPISVGFGIGVAIGQQRHKWKVGLGLMVITPAIFYMLYQWASSTGCSGGDCMGPMIGLILLGIVVVLITLTGFGIFIQAVLSNLAR